MSIILADGGALFLGPNWRLTHQSGSTHDSELCIFDFPIACFALSSQQNQIAILLKPEDKASETKSKASRPERRSSNPKKDKGDYCLKIFGFDPVECEVCDMKGSVMLHEARQILWSSKGDYLLTFDPPSGRVCIVRVSINPSDRHKLVLNEIASDIASSPHFYGSMDWCGLFNDRRQIVDYWDLATNTVSHSLQLSRRSIRVADSCVAGHLLITVYDDLSLTFAYWCDAEKKFIKLQKIDGLFPAEEENAKVSKMAVRIRSASRRDSSSGNMEIVVALSCSRHLYCFEASATSISLKGRSTVLIGDVVAALRILDDGPTVALSESGKLEFRRRSVTFEGCQEPARKERKERIKKDKKPEMEAPVLVELNNDTPSQQPVSSCATAAGSQPTSRAAADRSQVTFWRAVGVGAVVIGMIAMATKSLARTKRSR